MTTTIVVGSNIRLEREVSHELTNRLRGMLSWTNPAIGFKRSRGWWVSPKEDIDIKGYRLTEKYIYIPRGFLERLELMLKAAGIRYLIDDRRIWYKPTPYENNIQLFAHQIRPVKNMLDYEEGILEAPCGSGKSVMALKMICKWGQPTLVLAHTNAIIEQWQEYIEDFTGMKAGLILGGKFDVRKITIGSVMTLANRNIDIDFRRYFGVVILDEAHHTPAYSFQTILSQFYARHRLGITATPRRSDGLQGLLNAVAGPVRTKVPQESLFISGFAIRPTIYKVKTKFKIPESVENRDELLFSAIEDNVNRAIQIAEVAYARKHRSVLILSRRIAHLDHIYERLFDIDPGWTQDHAKVLTGRIEKDERLHILNDLRKGRLNIVLATQLADEGLDIPRLDTLLLTFPSSSELKLEQQMGRPMRSFPGKKDVEVYDFVDHRVPRLVKQAQRRTALYRRLRYPVVRYEAP